VAQRRELHEAEMLCVAALRGDEAEVKALVLGSRLGMGHREARSNKRTKRSDASEGGEVDGCSSASDSDSDSSGAGGEVDGLVPWDAEDRFGVTAGE
jgi:hypothetical protein